TGYPPRGAGDLPLSRVCRGRGPDELRRQHHERLPSNGRLCRPHSQGREAGRPTSPASHKNRADPQPQDFRGARHQSAADAACPRRRGDRMIAAMKRREFITLLGGAAAGWPLAARAQQPAKVPIIGFLGPGTPSAWSAWTAAFVQRLRELGWIEGRTLALEWRGAEGSPEPFGEIAAEFVG